MNNAEKKQKMLQSPPLPVWEVVGIVAGLMSLNALAIDIMLPALSDIQFHFGVEDDNERQKVIIYYLLGFGFAQLFYGPLMDRYGRRPILILSIMAYVASTAACLTVKQFESLLIARFLLGAAAGATRVVAVAVVRDFYSGRRMAEIMSIVMLIFMAAPILAPSIGQGVMMAFGPWQSVFWALLIAAVLIGAWSIVRLPETLLPENRIPLNPKSILQSYAEFFMHRIALGYMAASALVFAPLFAYVSSSEQVYSEVFNLRETFPLWFAGGAVCAAIGSYFNSKLVGRIGMRPLAHYGMVISFSVYALQALAGYLGFETFVHFYVTLMGSLLMLGVVGPNLNSTAMEPMGHIAGTASALYGFATTFVSALLGGLIADQYDGSIASMYGWNASVALLACVIIAITEKGRVFQTSESR